MKKTKKKKQLFVINYQLFRNFIKFISKVKNKSCSNKVLENGFLEEKYS